MSGITGDDALFDEPIRGGTDPNEAYDGNWEQAVDEGDGLEHHLLGESPVVPELSRRSPPPGTLSRRVRRLPPRPGR